MTFDDILEQLITLLKRQGRVSYRALKRRFEIDDNYIEDLKEEISYVHESTIKADDRGFIWKGETETTPAAPNQPTPPEPQPIAEQAHPVPATSSLIDHHSPEAERRQLTVMFCDLVGSTSLSGALDPEDFREVVRQYQQVCSEVVQRYDGHIAQYLGDGLLVYLGFPQAHEDDAQRAVRAGLGMIDAIETLNTHLEPTKGVKLAVRLGIHTGLVVVGEMGGEGRQEQLALGEVPNIAARIQGLAEPDTVVISAETYRLTEGFFECESLGKHDLRGVAQPIAVYRILGDPGIQSRLDVAGIRGLTPLVGRESESTLLFERWAQAKSGHGQVVLLSGEAGIGKSRLVQVLKDHVGEGPRTRIECRSSPYFTNSALYPIIDVLQRALRFQMDDTPEQRLEKLEHNLRPYRLPLDETVPLFAELLSLPMPEDRYAPLNLSPQRQRQKTLENLVAIMLELAEWHPLLFILDDAHWTDPTTLELIGLMIDQTPTASLVILITHRPEFQPTWGNRSYLTQLTLNRLSREGIEQIATQVAGGHALPGEVLQQLMDKTDGVPLYVEEMAKAVLESGALVEVDDQYELSGSISSLAIPATLQDSLMSRLDRLVTAKAVAQYASVIGRQFSYELLQAVSELDETILQWELGRLVEAELVYQRGVPPQAMYTFKHALVQDTAYESLLRRTRQGYHRRIAAVLAEQFPEMAETQPDLLAKHYTEAMDYEKATDSWKRAGKYASERSAYREAVTCFEQALETIKYLMECRDTLEQAIDIRFDLRNVLHPLGEDERIIENLRTTEAIARRLGDDLRLGQTAQYLCIYFTTVDAHDRAIEEGKRAIALFTSVKVIDLQAVAQCNLATAYSDMGDYRQVLDLSRQAMALLTGELLYERMGQAYLPALQSRVQGALSLAELGRFDEGCTLVEDALQMAETTGEPYQIASTLRYVGMVYRRQGDFDKAIPALKQCLALSQSVNITRFFPLIASTLGVSYAIVGRVAEACTLLNQVLERVATENRVAFHAHVLNELSKFTLLVGHVEEASVLAERLCELSRTHTGNGLQAHAYYLLAEVAMHRDAPEVEEAAPHYQQSLNLANELGMRPLQAHCHRGLGILYRQTGQSEQARAELSTAIEMYRDMEMNFWLPETETARAALEGQA